MRLLPIVLLIAVLVYALIDCGRTPKQEMPGRLPKWLWLTMIVVLVGVGPLAWIIVRLVASNERPEPAPPARTSPWSDPRPPRRRPGPAAPDDDPAFLARLEAERRRAARERGQGSGASGGGGAAGAPPHPASGQGTRPGPATDDEAAGGSPDGRTGRNRDGRRPDDGADRGRAGHRPGGTADDSGPDTPEEPGPEDERTEGDGRGQSG